VIFVYGLTNTWMERFGAQPGDPYTSKEIQHISIAVMFWFAGLVGMGLESHRLRRWLAALSTAPLMNGFSQSSGAITEPASYRGSFNPFPALVIGVTGAAMSAHFQTYLFQVSTAPTCVPCRGLKLRQGSNTRTLGLLSHRICLVTVLDLFLCLAETPALRPSFSSSFRSRCQFLSFMRRSDLCYE
jgi:Protein of unknown function (Ytp1)